MQASQGFVLGLLSHSNQRLPIQTITHASQCESRVDFSLLEARRPQSRQIASTHPAVVYDSTDRLAPDRVAARIQSKKTFSEPESMRSTPVTNLEPYVRSGRSAPSGKVLHACKRGYRRRTGRENSANATRRR